MKSSMSQNVIKLLLLSINYYVFCYWYYLPHVIIGNTCFVIFPNISNFAKEAGTFLIPWNEWSQPSSRTYALKMYLRARLSKPNK